jgi:hypothetical protein
MITVLKVIKLFNLLWDRINVVVGLSDKAVQLEHITFRLTSEKEAAVEIGFTPVFKDAIYGV